MLWTAAQALVPMLVPFSIAFGPIAVDYADHFGGALGGAALGVVLLRLWPERCARPQYQSAAAAAGAAFCFIGLGVIAFHWHSA
jgi:membrane associated rhomboid family serine protease